MVIYFMGQNFVTLIFFRSKQFIGRKAHHFNVIKNVDPQKFPVCMRAMIDMSVSRLPPTYIWLYLYLGRNISSLFNDANKKVCRLVAVPTLALSFKKVPSNER